MVGRLLVIGLVCASRAALAADCPPTAVSSGDPALVRSLSEKLAANGIATTTTDGCPAVRVRVEQRGTEVHLEAIESKLGQRQVRDVATAAAIVESWTRHEIEEGTLPELEHAEPPPPTRPAPSPTGITGAFESSISDGSALWLGGAVSGCVALGPVCAGATLRGAKDTRTTGDTADVDHRSTALQAIATLDVPRRAGAFTISPGIGLGYGWLDITTTHLDAHMLPVDVSVSSHELRADLHVSIVRPIAGRFAIVGELRGDTALARTDITGGAKSFARFAIGLRFGAP